MKVCEELPEGWTSLPAEAGVEYGGERGERFVNPLAGLVVEVALDDDGPAYRVEVLYDGEWIRMHGDCSRREAVDYARDFMRSVDLTAEVKSVERTD